MPNFRSQILGHPQRATRACSCAPMSQCQIWRIFSPILQKIDLDPNTGPCPTILDHGIPLIRPTGKA
ncbi:GL25455 [Drosophila persimilis]|uniref:GL25455 n=1 Tax=Drosophila persimilis TaxID=7234 RepID=B4H8P8_DROPE|nr:GL25455 [Drosophila persimilis]